MPETMKRIHGVLKDARVDSTGVKVRGGVARFASPGGDKAVKLWRRLRVQLAPLKLWPYVSTAERNPAEADIAGIVAKALKIDVPALLKKWRRDRAPSRDLAGVWPRGVRPETTLTTPFDLQTGRPNPSVWFHLVPAESSWEALAVSRVYTDGPAEESVALAKYWAERHGAEFAAVGHGLEFVVSRPPLTREAAMALAWEQYLCCPDIVDQGTETISRLAAMLLKGPVWFFWWD